MVEDRPRDDAQANHREYSSATRRYWRCRRTDAIPIYGRNL